VGCCSYADSFFFVVDSLVALAALLPMKAVEASVVEVILDLFHS
jgi:hypothetical protein